MLAREGRGGTVGGTGSYDWGRGGRGGAESSSCGSHRAGQDSVTHGATTHAWGLSPSGWEFWPGGQSERNVHMLSKGDQRNHRSYGSLGGLAL